MYPQNTCKRILRSQGIYVTTEISLVLALKGLWISITNHKKWVPLLAKETNKSDQDFIKELPECGELTPVIDRCYTLSEVLDALQYLEKGHARGKVVITMRR